MSQPTQKPGRSCQDYVTPPEFIRAVKCRLQIAEFDVDLAASPENAQAAVFYTEQDDALVQPWQVGSGWAWCNPPFARLEPWVEKAWIESQDHRAKIAMLVPAGVGSNWWAKWVHNKALVLLLNGRITFVGQPTCYPKDCCLLLYEFARIPTYEVWRWAQIVQSCRGRKTRMSRT